MRPLLFALLVPAISLAISFSDIKEQVRSTLLPYIGEPVASKIFGPTKSKKNTLESIVLPQIPKLDTTGKDSSIYKKKAIDSKVTKFSSLKEIEKEKYHKFFLQELYRVVSKKKISSDSLRIYIDRLSQGASREGIYRSLISSREYFELESNPSLAPIKLVNFTNQFGLKFLNLKLNKAVIGNSNRYLLKKNLTDKAIDIVDVLAIKPKDLYSWYAVFSSDISHFTFWRSKVRSNKSRDFHFRWAKSSSLDHIKSEVIIKLHQIGNSI